MDPASGPACAQLLGKTMEGGREIADLSWRGKGGTPREVAIGDFTRNVTQLDDRARDRAGKPTREQR